MAVGPSIFNQSQSVFDFRIADPTGIIPLQLTQPSAPAPSTVVSGTNPIVPDAPTINQLRNFPEEVYDLRDSSHLVRLMKAFLGDAGTGQLRKRVLLTRLENALSSTHFFDLDRFYGAIFGALRGPDEQLTINPMEEVATPDEWDTLMAADANFRERIMQLARAIEMGATIPGLTAAAQAVCSVPVDIYETWALLDAYGPGYVVVTNEWLDVEFEWPVWANFDNPQVTWAQVQGNLNLGNLPVPTRGEIIVRPHKNYNGDAASQKQKALDENALMRVLHVLKPASTIVTVSTDAGLIHVPVPLAGIQADSNYWEIVRKVTPDSNLSNVNALYPLAASEVAAGVDPLSSRILPIPPFSQGQGVSWSTNHSVKTVSSYYTYLRDIAIGDVPSNWNVSPAIDDQTLIYTDGIAVTYSVTKGLMNAQRASAALATSDGSLIAHPYSGDRQQVAPHA